LFLAVFLYHRDHYVRHHLFRVSLVGWSGSIVFYNSYLPDIATEDQLDRVSARGFSMGYIGSVLLMMLNLLVILKREWFGNISEALASRIAFLTVGLWWIGFAQIPFRHLPDAVQEVGRKIRAEARRLLPAQWFYRTPQCIRSVGAAPVD
jgi:UMF1 family MFS transporter